MLILYAINLKSKLVKLHLGCGSKHISGFIHIDILDAPHIDHKQRIETLPEFPDGSVDLIYACHVLEHFSRWTYKSALQEWFRVLKPSGGVLRLAVPDFAACAKIYHEHGLADGLSGLIGLIVGGQRNEYDIHYMIFDQQLLEDSLREVGFTSVRYWDWRCTDHCDVDDYSQAYLPHLDKQNGTLMSLNLEAIKQ